jgi:hypothetical protein
LTYRAQVVAGDLFTALTFPRIFSQSLAALSSAFWGVAVLSFGVRQVCEASQTPASPLRNIFGARHGANAQVGLHSRYGWMRKTSLEHNCGP